MALIDRDATHDAIGFERCDRSCTDCPTKCTWYYTVKNIPAVNRWIPCSERLPEKDTSVIIYAAGHRVSAYYDAVYDVFRLTESEDLFYLTSAVTHWMPMPEPPEKE